MNVNQKTRFRLPRGYASRDTPDYFNDAETLQTGRIWQPEVYELASVMVRNHGCNTVVDIGCGNGTKLGLLGCPTRIGVDYGANLDWCRRNHHWGIWIEQDLEMIDADSLAEYFGPSTVVVSADVIEHLFNPLPLVGLWRAAVDAGSILITSTPDRALNRGSQHNGPPDNPAHVREWSLDEYVAFLSDQGVTPTAAGFTISNDLDRELKTIITVHYGGVDGENFSAILFSELRPWLKALQRVGGAIMGSEDVDASDRKADKWAGFSALTGVPTDRLQGETTSIIEPPVPPTRSIMSPAFDRMILLASELVAAQAKLDAQGRELQSVRRELDERDERLRASEAARATEAEQVAQLCQALAERDEALKVANAAQSASTVLADQLRGEIDERDEALKAAEEARASQVSEIAQLRRELSERDEVLKAAEERADATQCSVIKLTEELADLEVSFSKASNRLSGLTAENVILKDHVWRARNELDALPKRALESYFAMRRWLPSRFLVVLATIFDGLRSRKSK